MTVLAKKSHQSYNFLDLMKFICAILVVAIHTEPFQSYSTMMDKALGIITRLPVPFFFITSGYLFFIKLDINSISTRDSFDKLKYYLNRIFSLYLSWSIIYFPFKCINWISSDTPIIKNILLYLRDFIFLGSYSSLWYLPALIFSIGATYFLLKFIPINRVVLISILLYIIGLLGSTYYGIISNINFLHSIFNYYNKFFCTTRNGLFYGFIFVVVGAYLAHHKEDFRSKRGFYFIGFIISMVLLTIESIMVITLKINIDTIMWISSVPATIFLFLFCININLPNSKSYKILRELSVLIYVCHGLFIILLPHLLKNLYTNSLIRFISVLLCSIIFSILAMKLANIKKMKNEL